MRLTLDSARQDPRYITSYQKNSFTINGQVYYETLLLYANKTETLSEIDHPDKLSNTLLCRLIQSAPDILIVGTGGKIISLPHEVYNTLLKEGIGLEVVDTSAACRTYNLLLDDHRSLAAILFPINYNN